MDTARKDGAQNGQGVTDAWMSVYDAKDALGVSRHKVQSLIIAGELVAKVIAGRTVITRASVARYQGEQAKQEAERAAVAK